MNNLDISPSNLPRLYAQMKGGAREEVAEKAPRRRDRAIPSQPEEEG
jgi:hypothetical protein